MLFQKSPQQDAHVFYLRQRKARLGRIKPIDSSTR